MFRAHTSRTLCLTTPFALAALAGGTAHAQCTTDTRLVANAVDRVTGMNMGASMSVWGDRILLGAPNDDFSGEQDTGTVFFFGRSGNQWGQFSKFRAPDWDQFDNFGSAIGQDGETAVIGARGRGGKGAVYFFDRTASVWVPNGTAAVPAEINQGDNFGYSCDLSGAWAVVGAPWHDATPGQSMITDEGAVYVYKRTGGIGTAWAFHSKLTSGMGGSAVGNHFGKAVAIDGNYIVAASPDRSGNAGIELWKRSGNAWTRVYGMMTNLTAGTSIDLKGDLVVLGVPGYDGHGPTDTGFVWPRRIVNDQLESEGFIVAPVSDQVNFARFGSSVSVDGDRIVVGAEGLGKVYSFSRRSTGEWAREGVLSALATSAAGYGSAVAVVGDTAFVADDSQTTGGTSMAGAAHIFSLGDTIADTCEGALFLNTPNTYGPVTSVTGCSHQALPDGSATCGNQESPSPDVFYTIVPDFTGRIVVDTEGSAFDTVLSFHSACPATAANTIACDDDSGSTTLSRKVLDVAENQFIVIRVAGFNAVAHGAYTLNIRRLCPADVNLDGQIDFFDYLDFAQIFSLEDPAADFNGDNQTDFFDYLDFASAFDAGC